MSLRRHRVWHVPVASVAETVLLIKAVEAATVVLDVEPMIVRWRGTEREFRSGAGQFLDAIAVGAPSVHAVVISSNARAPRPPVRYRGAITLRSRAGKPWRVGYLRDMPRPLVVVGDQIVTDGVLAWRMRGTFLHWHHELATPWWPRLQAAAGRVLGPLFLTRKVRLP